MGKLSNFLLFFFVLALMTAASAAGYNLAFRDLIFPKVTISGIDVGGMDRESASKLIELYFTKEPSIVVLRQGEKENRRFENFSVNYDYKWAAEQAYGIGRTGNPLTRINEQISHLINGGSVNLPVKYDNDEFEGIFLLIEEQLNTQPQWPKLIIKNGLVEIVQGKNGSVVDTNTLKSAVLEKFVMPGRHLIDVPMRIVIAEENPAQSENAKNALSKWIGRKLVLRNKDVTHELDESGIASLLGLVGERIDETSFEKLIEEISDNFETEAKDAILLFENDKVREFRPEIVGTKIDIPAFKTELANVLYTATSDSLDVPVIVTHPKITTGEINNLGIKELIGTGKSQFAHSIPGRVHNVSLASSRINGIVVAPGEEFSFNEAVGEISRETGYQSAYIISGGKTVLGDGGGVCQVSTTVFRAALDSGLPIIERKAHAYRVGYYEQDSKPGIDATVFNPSADFKFKNDTGHHILIQTIVDTKNYKMSIDFYGTKDGREATLSEPKVGGQVAPPETLYVDDPTLAKGVTKQIDWSAWGAKVSFDYKVERGGEVLFEKTFFSNYQPWRAVYLRGTKI